MPPEGALHPATTVFPGLAEEFPMMAILVERATLLRGCRLAERVLPARTAAADSAHLLVQADGARCTLHAVGGGVALHLPLPAEVERPGQALLPARQTLAILRAADAEVLRLES